jgi:hypothetical protein
VRFVVETSPTPAGAILIVVVIVVIFVARSGRTARPGSCLPRRLRLDRRRLNRRK